MYDLPIHVFEEMRHFFKVYKELENKETAVDELGDREEAEKIIEYCMKNYSNRREELMDR